jgi:hypothetical protein
MSAEARAPAGEKGTADRIEADEGMFWVRLVTRQALDREGAAMQHCVGDGDYDALVGGEELHDDAIWSLRRADGSSALTVRVRRGELDYARGFSNHGPGKGACLQVRHLAAAFAAAGHSLAVDEDTGIVLLDDGRTFRRDRLPPEVVAAREAAERARRADRETGWRRLREGVYKIGPGQVFFAPRAPDATFHQIGDIKPFVLGRRVEIRTDERPERAIIEEGISRGLVHPAIARAATASAPDPSTPECLLGLGVHHRVEVDDIIQLTLPNGESAFDVRDVEVLSGEGIRVPPERYVVDARLGMVRFLDRHACLEIRFRAGQRPASVQLTAGPRLPADVYLPWTEEPITSLLVAIDPPREEAPPPERLSFQTLGAVAIKAEFLRVSGVLTADAEGRTA